MKLRIEIDMDNDAFGDDPSQRATEASRCINEFVRQAVSNGLSTTGYEYSTLRDINGNIVGTAKVRLFLK